jgi:hypothetical protein
MEIKTKRRIIDLLHKNPDIMEFVFKTLKRRLVIDIDGKCILQDNATINMEDIDA